MTYDVYAMFREGAYRVVETNCAEHGAAVAERVCKELDQWPMAFATLIRGEHVLNCKKFEFADLKKRG